MHFQVTHNTRYEYAAPVGRCYNLAHMMPRDTRRQACLRNQVEIKPHPAHTHKHQDYFGNSVLYFAIQKNHNFLDISVESELELAPLGGSSELDWSPSWSEVVKRLGTSNEPDCLVAREYTLDSPMIRAGVELREYALKSLRSERPFLDSVRELNRRIFEDFTYDPGFTSVATPLHEVWQHRRGVCQDFAHVAIACLRAAGCAARYVSGYLETLPPPGQQKLIGADATHAWFEVYCPGEGWVEFDPTNNDVAGEQHIVTAWGRDYSDVAPLRGVIFGGGETPQLSVAVTVLRVET